MDRSISACFPTAGQHCAWSSPALTPACNGCDLQTHASKRANFGRRLRSFHCLLRHQIVVDVDKENEVESQNSQSTDVPNPHPPATHLHLLSFPLHVTFVPSHPIPLQAQPFRFHLPFVLVLRRRRFVPRTRCRLAGRGSSLPVHISNEDIGFAEVDLLPPPCRLASALPPRYGTRFTIMPRFLRLEVGTRGSSMVFYQLTVLASVPAADGPFRPESVTRNVV